jgi:hypothetical protein
MIIELGKLNYATRNDRFINWLCSGTIIIQYVFSQKKIIQYVKQNIWSLISPYLNRKNMMLHI